MVKVVRAYTNIALIKYWGKADRQLKIPCNSSLSLTLDQFYTETSVNYDTSLESDVFLLDGVLVDNKVSRRVFEFMDVVRERYNIKEYARIESYNHVPQEAGLASSASAFAALAKASTLHLNLDDEEVSRLARLGSGSASRSIYGGFVVWNRGSRHDDSYAKPIEMEPWHDFRMVVCILNDGLKPYPSSVAMNITQDESPYFNAWIREAQNDIEPMTKYVMDHNIENVGLLAQKNALKMHASLMAANMWYFEPKTLEIMNIVRELQKTIPVYFTMDAGPNVKIMTTEEHVNVLIKHLRDVKTVVCKPGKGIEVYDR